MRLLLAVLLFVGAASCAHVSPWEREQLAAIETANASHAGSRRYEAHFWNVREGQIGGTGEPGGGCGCN